MDRKLSRQIRETRRSNRQNRRKWGQRCCLQRLELRAEEAARRGHPLSGTPKTWLATSTPAGWLGSSWPWPASPSAEASNLGASPCGRRPPATLSCNPLLNHARRVTYAHSVTYAQGNGRDKESLPGSLRPGRIVLVRLGPSA